MDNEVKLTLSEFRILDALRTIASKEGTFDTSAYNMHKVLNLSLSSVVKAYRRFKDLGVIEKVKEKEVHRYRIKDMPLALEILQSNVIQNQKIEGFK